MDAASARRSCDDRLVPLRLDASECSRQLLGADRPGHVVVHPRGEAGVAILGEGVCGHRDGQTPS